MSLPLYLHRSAGSAGQRYIGQCSTVLGMNEREQFLDRPIGKKIWAIAEGYIPSQSHGPKPEMVSHEALCILNTGNEDAEVEVMIYYTDREPVGPYTFKVPARRTRHIRFNNFEVPENIPLGTEYSSVIKSNVPVIVQHTRLDSRQSENALLSTIAYSE